MLTLFLFFFFAHFLSTKKILMEYIHTHTHTYIHVYIRVYVVSVD